MTTSSPTTLCPEDTASLQNLSVVTKPKSDVAERKNQILAHNVWLSLLRKNSNCGTFCENLAKCAKVSTKLLIGSIFSTKFNILSQTQSHGPIREDQTSHNLKCFNCSTSNQPEGTSSSNPTQNRFSSARKDSLPWSNKLQKRILQGKISLPKTNERGRVWCVVTRFIKGSISSADPRSAKVRISD